MTYKNNDCRLWMPSPRRGSAEVAQCQVFSLHIRLPCVDDFEWIILLQELEVPWKWLYWHFGSWLEFTWVEGWNQTWLEEYSCLLSSMFSLSSLSPSLQIQTHLFIQISFLHHLKIHQSSISTQKKLIQ